MADEHTDPVLRELIDTKKAYRNLSIFTGIFVFLVSGIIAVAFFVRANDLERLSQENRDATQLLCSVTESFGGVISAAADSIDRNLRNGTYARAIDQGLLTREGLDLIIQQRDAYRDTHRALENPIACERLLNE